MPDSGSRERESGVDKSQEGRWSYLQLSPAVRAEKISPGYILHSHSKILFNSMGKEINGSFSPITCYAWEFIAGPHRDQLVEQSGVCMCVCVLQDESRLLLQCVEFHRFSFNWKITC